MIHFNQNEIIRAFYQTLGSVGPLSNNVEIAWNHYQNMKGTENETNAYNLYVISEERVENALKKVSTSYLNFNRELQKIMIQLRQEMRKFEY